MSAYLRNPESWQASWDRQQEAFMPDREQRFGAMLDALAAVASAGTAVSSGAVAGAADGAAPRVLDLAGGTGTITLRTLARFPRARVTVLDQDPVLLAIAEASLRDRAVIVDADLSDSAWRAKVPEDGFDAVLTATALHWLPAERVAALYAEVREVLRPGGIVVNADHMPEESLPTFSEQLRDHGRARREAQYAAGGATSWPDWWRIAAADEFLGPRVAERELIYPVGHHSEEWTPPATWHVNALREAGFAEAGVLWRGGTDAAVVGLR